jgi:hypothetical protein
MFWKQVEEVQIFSAHNHCQGSSKNFSFSNQGHLGDFILLHSGPYCREILLQVEGFHDLQLTALLTFIMPEKLIMSMPKLHKLLQ